MKSRNLPLLCMIIPLITSCISTSNIRVLKPEVLGMGILAIDSIDTIAIFNRDNESLQPDTFYFKDAALDKMVKDTLISYKDLSNTCTDALADYLRSTGYFKAVINYRDSLNYPTYAQNIALREQKQNKMDVDACIILHYIALRDELMNNIYYFDHQVISSFPEFENSTMMETLGTRLGWSIVYKNNNVNKSYRRNDNLFYGNSVDPDLFGSMENHRKLLTNAAGYLGESFAAELFPHMQRVTRIYCRSNNPQMLKAEKNLLSEEYIEAAAIYSRLTNSKNKNIAAKACYNMALICEIEGDLEAAFDWLSRSVTVANKYDYHHFSRCDEYVALLKKMQKEIESQEKQMMNKEANDTDL